MDSVWLGGPMGVQAFWLWMIFGGLLLGAEILIGTQWLLWLAAAAGVVAVVCLTALPVGFLWQVVFFTALSVLMVVAGRRLLKAPTGGPDINDVNARLIGKPAQVIEGFSGDGATGLYGRVLVDGVEWPASLDGAQGVDGQLVVSSVAEGRLVVRSAD